MVARSLMFQGTGSDVGKSLVVAGLARAFTLRGLKVLPFKPQNMSNNAAVTADGGEIGRAQALQARAAKVPLSVHMNPVLLKPQSEVGAQVVVQGRVEGNAKAAEYQDLKRDIAAAERAWDKARELMADPTMALIILDELNIALRYDYLDLKSVIETLGARRPDLHVVITGRNAKPELIAAADLVTDMTLVKHHFAAGVKAQPGIEF